MSPSDTVEPDKLGEAMTERQVENSLNRFKSFK